MAVAFRSSTSTTIGVAVTSRDIPNPGSLAVNDLMIAHFAGRFYTSHGVTAPSGWTQIEYPQAGAFGCYTAYKFAVQADVDATTFTFTCTTAHVGGAIIAFSGTHLTTPIQSSTGLDATGSTAVTSATITPSVADTMLCIFTGWGDVVSSVSGYAIVTNDPGTWVEGWDAQAGGGGGGGFSAARSALRSQTTATGDFQATLANSQVWTAVAVVIRPPAAAVTKRAQMMLTGVG